MATTIAIARMAKAGSQMMSLFCIDDIRDALDDPRLATVSDRGVTGAMAC